MVLSVNELAPKLWLPQWKFPAVESMRSRLGQEGRVDEKSFENFGLQGILASFFLAWFVLAVVLRSLGRWQKKRRTERYFVNLENCRTKGFTMERNTCLDTGQHGLEKSKLKHFINDI